ncbi:MAG: N-acetylglucosamine-6-phosphate deacetylase [Actinomycetota bacterium]|nr:N-acetylglucosamine-6-phosphate deacetylase [Actinomycetota bacterium]
MRVGVKAAKVGDAIVTGDVVIEDGHIAEVGVSPPGKRNLAAPGFVDLQVNGFGGVDFLSADEDGYRSAGRVLASTGVTAYQPTFITSPMDTYTRALEVARGLGPAPGGPRILGIHLEGPWLNPKWKGAHNPHNLVEPNLEAAEQLCAAGPVSYVTLAPELPGGLELIGWLVERGIVIACGHCDADARTAHAAFDRGASAVTHIYNAQRRWQARDPGVAGVALVRPDVTVQAIVDYVHLAPETAYAAFLASRGRFALVTDAIMAAGLGDGAYRLGDRDVTVADGAARLDDGTLAGSVATMDEGVRNLMALGASPADALDASSRVPARLVGRSDLGDLLPGAPADIVVLDDSMTVRRTLVDGVEVWAA